MRQMAFLSKTQIKMALKLKRLYRFKMSVTLKVIIDNLLHRILRSDCHNGIIKFKIHIATGFTAKCQSRFNGVRKRFTG